MSTPNTANINELSEQDLALISACLDNQLPSDELTAFKKRLLQEPTLNAHYQQFKKMDQHLKQHVTNIDQTPISQGISELLNSPDINNKESSNNTSISTPATKQPRLIALAATIAAVGLLSYQVLIPQKLSTDNIASTQIKAPAQQNVSTQVHEALSQMTSMDIKDLGNEGKMVVLQSFYNTQGQPCREYQLANDANKQHAIACYGQQQWFNVASNIQSNQTNQQQYQTASKQNPQQITNYLSNIKEQMLINKQQEQDLISLNWNLTKN